MPYQSQIIITVGSIFGFLSVATGAFGAHALEGTLGADKMAIWETASSYQMYHALALLAVGYGIDAFGPNPWFTTTAWLFGVGVVVFSGSLYTLALTDISWLGAITPLGGLCFLAGWASMAIGVY